MKYDVQFTNQFKRDLKLAKKQNKNLDKLYEVIDVLANGGTLDAKYRDHDLTGKYKGTRECHIEPDWLLLCHTDQPAHHKHSRAKVSQRYSGHPRSGKTERRQTVVLRSYPKYVSAP